MAQFLLPTKPAPVYQPTNLPKLFLPYPALLFLLTSLKVLNHVHTFSHTVSAISAAFRKYLWSIYPYQLARQSKRSSTGINTAARLPRTRKICLCKYTHCRSISITFVSPFTLILGLVIIIITTTISIGARDPVEFKHPPPLPPCPAMRSNFGLYHHNYLHSQ